MPLRALVIDDSRAMRSIIANIFAEIGIEVLEASDGEQALACVEDASGLDLALVDWNLPGISGLDFVRAVRANPDYQALRLMMVTTETEIERVSQALDAGADEYIMKPFTKEMLIDKLTLMGMETS